MALSVGVVAERAMQALLEAGEIDGQPATVEAMAKAAFALALEAFEKKAKFYTVCTSFRFGADGAFAYVPLDEQEWVTLGPFSTENQARTAGQSLGFATTTAEQWAWRVVPAYHGTGAAFHKERRERAKEQLIEHADDKCGKLVEFGNDWLAYCVNDKGHADGYCRVGPREDLMGAFEEAMKESDDDE